MDVNVKIVCNINVMTFLALKFVRNTIQVKENKMYPTPIL